MPSLPQPVGVFDSGVGGLSVLREIRAALPHENLLYVADSAHIPYGEKTPAFIEARTLAIGEFLLAQGAKTIVVACNTASSVALATLRRRFSVPIVGMEPALKPAAQLTRSGVVGVLATRQTLASERFADLVSRFGAAVTVHVQPCAGWVEQVEAGRLNGDAVRAVVERHVAPLLARGADVLVLGCTHYPFLRPIIGAVAGPEVQILDPNRAVARELARRLSTIQRLAPATTIGRERFWTSGAPASVLPVVAMLWGEPVEVAQLPA